MKYLYFIILTALLTNCKSSKDDFTSGRYLGTDSLEINNHFEVNYSPNDINNILQLAKQYNLNHVDSIDIGWATIAGIYTNRIFIYEKEFLKSNSHNLIRKYLTCTVKYWNSTDTNISKQFYSIENYNNQYWQLKIDGYAMNIKHDDEDEYNEARDIINMIKTKSYVVKCNFENIYQQEAFNEVANRTDSFKEVTVLGKDGEAYHISFGDYGCFPILTCIIKNDSLIINDVHVLCID